jgi:AcrR family transcriptional regulator
MAMSLEKRLKIQQAREKQILDVALTLFDKMGYANTKIDDISEAAGISKGLIYRYFDTKADILYAYTDAMQECLDEIKGFESPIESIRVFGERLLSNPYQTGYLPPLRVFITVFVRGEIDPNTDKNPMKNDFGRKYFGPIFKRGQVLNQFKSGDPEEFADIYWHYLLGQMTHVIERDNSCNVIPNLDAVINLFRPEK